MNRPILDKGPIGRAILFRSCQRLDVTLTLIGNMRYGRLTDTNDHLAVLKELKGTCSSKHVLVKRLADEQGWEDVELICCLYRMSESNTPGIGECLKVVGLDHLPEAHLYLKISGQPTDLTFPHSDHALYADDIIEEQVVTADWIAREKAGYHREKMAEWLNDQNAMLSLEDVWEIRENCISELSSTGADQR